MKIGLTYDLRDHYLAQGCSHEEAAEFDSIETIEAIEHSLHELGFITERISHLPALMSQLLKGHRWDLVFNIAEGRYGLAREAQVPALLDAYQIPYVFSSPATLAICLDKSIAKHLLRSHGLATAPFWVLHQSADISQYQPEFCYPLFVKPIAEGSSKGIGTYSKVETLAALTQTCTLLWEKFQQPVLAEIYLPGREFTVGLIGEGQHATVLGVMEIEFNANAESAAYSFVNKQEWRQRVNLKLAEDSAAQQAAALSLACWRALACRDAGRIDIRFDADHRPCFMEVNPLAGLNPDNSDLIIIGKLLGLSYQDIIQRIMTAALSRLKLTHHLTAIPCAF